MQPSNQIWYLIARSLSGEASREDTALLSELLQHDAALQQQYDILKIFWSADQPTPDAGDGKAAPNKISRILQLAKVEELVPVNHEKQKRRPARRRRTLRYTVYAAIGVTALLIAGLLRKGNPAAEKAGHQGTTDQLVATQNGSRTRVMLPDGSTVWLNAGSKIFYDKNFAGATREIKLEGEAYFDVVKNPHRPFIVHTSGIDIKVLGTVFNVKSYPADKTVETTLLRGLVAVTRQGYPAQKPVYLHPNEKLVIQKGPVLQTAGGKTIQTGVAPAIEYKLAHLESAVNEAERLETAWVYNRLEFRGEDFETLAAKLERWYNVNIVFDDEPVKRLTFNGSFEKESVEQAFTALKAAVPFNFSITGRIIHVQSLNGK